MISKIWFVFENYSQKLFKRCQNKKNKFFDEKLILKFLIIINKILKLIKNIIEKRLKLKLKKLKIVNDKKLLKKIVLLLTILFIYLSIRFVDIIVVDIVESFENDYVFKNNNFRVQSFKKLNQRCVNNKFEYLFSKIKFKIVSNVEKLIINEKIFNCFNITQNILHVNTRRFVVTHIDINKTFVLKIFYNNDRTLFKTLY